MGRVVSLVNIMYDDSIRSIWRVMKSRCFSHNKDNYCRYGGRGITVCSGLLCFSAFVRVLGPRPSGYTLDRINSGEHYSCGECNQCQERGWTKNVQWANQHDQNINRRPQPHKVNPDIIYRGVTRRHNHSGYRASIRDNGKLLELGSFPTASRGHSLESSSSDSSRGERQTKIEFVFRLARDSHVVSSVHVGY